MRLRSRLLIRAGAAALMVALRVMIIGRDADVDELFSVWISRKPLDDLFATLRHDSGPPLYYLILHAIDLVSPLTVTTARVFSLVARLLHC